MKLKVISTAILIIAFLFPFRYTFIEHPSTIIINDTAVEPHAMRSMFFFLLFFTSFMFWLFTITGDSGKTAAEKKSVERNITDTSGKHVA